MNRIICKQCENDSFKIIEADKTDINGHKIWKLQCDKCNSITDDEKLISFIKRFEDIKENLLNTIEKFKNIKSNLDKIDELNDKLNDINTSFDEFKFLFDIEEDRSNPNIQTIGKLIVANLPNNMKVDEEKYDPENKKYTIEFKIVGSSRRICKIEVIKNEIDKVIAKIFLNGKNKSDNELEISNEQRIIDIPMYLNNEINFYKK